MSDEARLTAIRERVENGTEGPLQAQDDLRFVLASHARAVKAQEQEKEFYDRCQELGATDTDIVKHALDDQSRIRREMVPMSLHIQQLEADLTAKDQQLQERTAERDDARYQMGWSKPNGLPAFPKYNNMLADQVRRELKQTETALAEARQQLDALQEALTQAGIILEGLHMSVQWELAPPIMQAISEVVPRIRVALMAKDRQDHEQEQELPPSLQGSLDLFREDPKAWHEEWSRKHEFSVRILTENDSLRAALPAVRAQLEQAEKNAATNYQYRLQAETELAEARARLADKEHMK